MSLSRSSSYQRLPSVALPDLDEESGVAVCVGSPDKGHSMLHSAPSLARPPLPSVSNLLHIYQLPAASPCRIHSECAVGSYRTVHQI